MTHGQSTEFNLDVEASKEGRKSRQAEYLLLAYLYELEVASHKEVKSEVRDLSKTIADKDTEPPIYFSRTNGSVKSQARGFNEILDRCLAHDWVETTIDGKYGITNDGRERVETIKRSNQYGIDSEFVETIEQAIRS
jgi:hypothetical protein